ncbi:Orotidine 5'-phosphate decarboxylase5 / FY16936)) [Taphrina deformans PYCC 5710]|uniref:Orotidine 5'-phosphate decarboxylase n=1 Tax=Taphrina deformans (strain PYCC 5710 / ATCC 11124 / CBS 356.35 / IMI 108563 / JCM 9778 / NBRC 8474) TaxID=1097556 RepID=R4XAF6_TAPDE|nr:Orotidine 5'-phosphate decarboxylase5 / FY16936)) [Taphrina deformans PYCC 5710]|eukprot:CCG81254.1 Orotidine 5'-phosphate decarboxylase5 / FY16936)) [Taphrina deformans PYCC 5710]
MPGRTYGERASACRNPLTRSLLHIMMEKETNLCVAVDVTSSSALLDLIPEIGPHICVLKLHIDILTDFTPSVITALLALKARYNFLIFEDRKFADIGSTVASQYRAGIYKIVEWADLVTVHSVPGPGIITGLKSATAGVQSPRGILLLAEMSSAGNLCPGEYARRTVEMAGDHKDFVVGFISQSRPETITDEYLVLTPGVSLAAKGDAMGQQYATPQNAIERNSDIIIVGRGIYGAADIAGTTMEYKQAGWQAYLDKHPRESTVGDKNTE